MKTRLSTWLFPPGWLLPAGLGGALALLAGCNASPASGQMAAGLWSCFDTGSGVACVKQAVLSTADVDVDGDGIPDHFVCADDDDDDGHDRGRDRDQNDHAVSGNDADHDADHDGIDDDLDCDARPACESLSDDDNPDRHGGDDGTGHGDNAGAGHDGDDDGDDGGDHDDGLEMHAGETCTAPTT